jgi:transcriptional regulator
MERYTINIAIHPRTIEDKIEKLYYWLALKKSIETPVVMRAESRDDLIRKIESLNKMLSK